MEIDIRNIAEQGIDGIIFADNDCRYASKLDLKPAANIIRLVDLEGMSEEDILISDIPTLIKALRKVVELTS